MTEFNSGNKQENELTADVDTKEAEMPSIEMPSVDAAPAEEAAPVEEIEAVEEAAPEITAEATDTAETVETSEAAEAVEPTEKATAEVVEKTEPVAAPAVAAAAVSTEQYVERKQYGKPKKVKKTRISYERKKRLYGYAFIGLWIVGTIYMFIIPLFQSIWYSLCYTELVGTADKIAEYGMSGPGIYTEWNDFGNYYNEFFTDQKFAPALTQSLSSMVPNTALILVFSLFIALLLQQKFKGRTLARAIFFLPVLIATGPVLAIINGDMGTQGVNEAEQFSALFEVDMVNEFLDFMGFSNISPTLTEQIQTITSDIFNLIWKSGIQILIFLAALQQIPVSAREAAAMEGATGWEFFWKITFPTISPMILANLVYTVIDVFIDSENPVMKYVIDQAVNWNHGFSAAMAWTYFAIVGVALGIIMAIASKFVFYQVD